eukprot:65785-Amphidinium_carterae.1
MDTSLRSLPIPLVHAVFFRCDNVDVSSRVYSGLWRYHAMIALLCVPKQAYSPNTAALVSARILHVLHAERP